MVRRVFFSFHFERDSWRAGQVRNSGITKEISGFVDAAAWEEVKRRGDQAIKNWIDNQLSGTSVTVVLIGAETSSRPYVRYELEQSWKRGNGILGIYVHRIKDSYGYPDTMGSTSFGNIFTSVSDYKKTFSDRFSTYDWFGDNGYQNIDSWVEAAAQQAGR